MRGKSRRKKNRKKKGLESENPSPKVGEQEGDQEGQPKSQSAKVKPKRGVFSRLFSGRTKKRKRAKTVNNKQDEPENDELDGDDLIDQLYNSTKAGIDKKGGQTSGFTSFNQSSNTGLNNFSSKNESTVTTSGAVEPEVVALPENNPVVKDKEEEEPKHVSFKSTNNADTNKNKGQSIRSLLETENPKIVKETKSQTSTEKDDDTIILDTEKILNNQYEEITDDIEPVKEESSSSEKEVEVVEPASIENEEKKDSSKNSLNEDENDEEVKPNNSKLFDFLQSLEKDDDEEEEEDIDEGEVETLPVPPPPPTPKLDVTESNDVEKVTEPPKIKRRRENRVEEEAIRVQPRSIEKSLPPSIQTETNSSKDVDRIIESLSFDKSPREKEPNVDLDKVKAELREEILADLSKDDSNDELKELKREQEEFKQLLEKEQSIKEELSLELNELKEQIKKAQKNEVEEKSESGSEKIEEEKALVERLIEQNEKQLQRMETMLLESKEEERKLRETVEKGRETALADKELNIIEERELKRIVGLTRQIELEQSFMLEEQERKEAFDIAERERLKGLKDEGISDDFEFNLSPTPRTIKKSDYFKVDESLSLRYVMNLVEDKFFSPHFEDALWFMFYSLVTVALCSFGIIYSGRNDEEDQQFVSMLEVTGLPSNRVAAVVFSQLVETNGFLFTNLFSLVSYSMIFLVTDTKPGLIREIYASSYLITSIFLLFGSFLKLCSIRILGVSGIIMGMKVFLISRGIFTNKAFERLISLIVLSISTHQLASAGFKFQNWPLYIGGSVAGYLTSYLANTR